MPGDGPRVPAVKTSPDNRGTPLPTVRASHDRGRADIHSNPGDDAHNNRSPGGDCWRLVALERLSLPGRISFSPPVRVDYPRAR